MKKNRLKSIIEGSGVKQRFIAEKIGVTDALLSKWVNNRVQPRIDNLFKLSKALDCEIEEIYCGD